jgi:DNA-binding MarR family transcriptional regulator
MITTDRPAAVRFDSLPQEAFLNLWRTYDRLRILEDAMFSTHDLSAQQYNALRLLRAVDPFGMPVLELGSRLISRAPDMTRLLDKLEDRGLVTRTRRTDNRRVVDVAITAEGRDLLDQMAVAVLDCHQRQLGHLNDADLHQLIALLRRARLPHEEEPWPRDV